MSTANTLLYWRYLPDVNNYTYRMGRYDIADKIIAIVWMQADDTSHRYGLISRSFVGASDNVSDSMAACDKELIRLGYTLLSRDQSDRIEVLL